VGRSPSPSRLVAPKPDERRMRLRPTRNVLLIGAAALAALLVSTTTAGAVGTGASPRQAPGSLADAQKQVKDARKRQDAAQKALEAAEKQRQLAQARQKEAARRLASVTGQLRHLRALVGVRARSTYMTGSAMSVATVVGAGDADDMLDKM
jgi:peptidoglycan hydrolase CwlO-like protein